MLRVTILLLATAHAAFALSNLRQAPNTVVVAENDTAQLLQERGAAFARLKAHMHQVCQTHPVPDDERFSLKKRFWVAVERSHNVAYCIHNKAASSTIMRHLYRLRRPHHTHRHRIWANGREKKLDASRLGVHNPSEMNAYRRKTGTFVFTFARHPYVRLVSGFINKVASREDPAYIPLANKLDGSFTKFVSFVLDEAKRGEIDGHWAPWSQHCDPCTMDFDFISKVESFTEDMRYVVAKANLKGSHLEVGRVRRVSSQDFEKSDHGERTRKYMDMLSQKQRDGLYDLYSRDFELLDYPLEP